MITQTYTIVLSTFEIIVFMFICTWIVLTAHPEVALGIYFAMGGWTRTVQVGPIAHTWVLLVTILFATVILILRGSRDGRSFHFPQSDRWVLPWLAFWWGWMILLFIVFRADFPPGLFVNLVQITLLFVIIPLPFLMLIPDHSMRIRNFALGYSLTAIASGWYALQAIDIPLNYLLIDPTLTTFGVIRLGVVNYHFIAYPYAISAVLIFGFLAEFKNVFIRGVFLLGILINIYFLILSGSRQSILGCVAGILFLSLWILLRRKVVVVWILPLLVGILFAVNWLVLQAPHLVRLTVADGQLNLTSTVVNDIVQSRGDATWQLGYEVFLSSPISGVGFSKHYISHNLFIGTLADQGIVGLIFLVGFLVFWARQAILAFRETQLSIENVWRMVLVAIMVFVLVQSQFSGSPLAEWAMWWSTAFLWKLNKATNEHNLVYSSKLVNLS